MSKHVFVVSGLRLSLRKLIRTPSSISHMAKIINDLFEQYRSVKYPWDEWLDGQARELRKGVDFHLGSYSMASQIRAMAARRGLQAKVIRLGEHTLLVQARRRADGGLKSE